MKARSQQVRLFNYCLLPRRDAIVNHDVNLGESQNPRQGVVMKKIATGGAALVMVMVFVLCPATSRAFKQSDLDKLLATKQCAFCDLRQADLSGKDLSGGRLSGANLSDANLSGANLSGANLRTCTLRRAQLSGANLAGADLSRADMTDGRVMSANLVDAKMMRVDLTKAVLSNSDLTNADLTGADLKGADIFGARFKNVNLSLVRWVDGSKCKEDSSGECDREIPQSIGFDPLK